MNNFPSYPILNSKKMDISDDDLNYVLRLCMEGIEIDTLTLDGDGMTWKELFLEMSDDFTPLPGKPRNRTLIAATRLNNGLWNMIYDGKMLGVIPNDAEPMTYQDYKDKKSQGTSN